VECQQTPSGLPCHGTPKDAGCYNSKRVASCLRGIRDLAARDARIQNLSAAAAKSVAPRPVVEEQGDFSHPGEAIMKMMLPPHNHKAGNRSSPDDVYVVAVMGEVNLAATERAAIIQDWHAKVTSTHRQSVRLLSLTPDRLLRDCD
jgi:hypothetical protein